jgi:hypothetical protein
MSSNAATALSSFLPRVTYKNIINATTQQLIFLKTFLKTILMEPLIVRVKHRLLNFKQLLTKGLNRCQSKWQMKEVSKLHNKKNFSAKLKVNFSIR